MQLICSPLYHWISCIFLMLGMSERYALGCVELHCNFTNEFLSISILSEFFARTEFDSLPILSQVNEFNYIF